LPDAGAKSPDAETFCSAAEAPDSTHEAFCPSHGVANGSVDAFLLDAEANSFDVGVSCSDAGPGKGDAKALSSDADARTLDDGVPRLVQEAMGAAAAVPRTGCSSAKHRAWPAKHECHHVFAALCSVGIPGGMDDHAALADRRRRDLRRRYRV